MHTRFRHAAASLLLIAASNVSAGVITQDGVVFTSTHVGNVLTLEIDAAGRSGGWAGATAIDALAIKTVGSFSGVSMTSSTGADWSLRSSELYARGCGSARSRATTADLTRLCYTGAGVALADNMVFTFTFSGTPALSAPHLKVHFVDAKGSKVGSLLSLDFPWQAAGVPTGSQTGSSGSTGSQPGANPVPELIPAPVVTQPVKDPVASGDTLPVRVTDGAESQVPEPRTFGLLTAGLVMLGVARRRK